MTAVDHAILARWGAALETLREERPDLLRGLLTFDSDAIEDATAYLCAESGVAEAQWLETALRVVVECLAQCPVPAWHA